LPEDDEQNGTAQKAGDGIYEQPGITIEYDTQAGKMKKYGSSHQACAQCCSITRGPGKKN
jgi:hypothetical protein